MIDDLSTYSSALVIVTVNLVAAHLPAAAPRDAEFQRRDRQRVTAPDS